MIEDFDTHEWETPPEIFEQYNNAFNFSFDLAASKLNRKLGMCFTKEMDAFKHPWHKLNGWLWLNPPYGRSETPIWVARADEEAQLGANIVSLIPASVGTRWFHKHIYKKYRHDFLEGRVKFLANGKPQGSPRFDSMIVYFTNLL